MTSSQHPHAHDGGTDWATWAALDELVDGGGLTTDGRRVARLVLEGLRELLGPTWPRRQQAAFGGLPGELRLFASHAAALPQFLNLALRLRAALDEPTFAPLRTALVRGLTRSDWRHLVLQLEVARLGAATGLRARFEPRIAGTARSAHVVLGELEKQPRLLVETTSLFRSVPDLAHQTYEQRLGWAMRGIEQRHGVFLQMELTAHDDEDGTATWLGRIDAAAAVVRRTGTPQTVSGPAGTATIWAEAPTEPWTTFAGAAHGEDGWRRLARALFGKARQTSGASAAWIRIDALDGFFQFTDWRGHSWTDRVDRLAAAAQATVAGADHVAGIVVSSGPATALGARDPTAEDVTATTTAGVGLRRLLAPHVVRETFVIPLQPAVSDQMTVWSTGYAGEPAWLDHDLTAAGLPLLSAWRV